MPDTWSIPRCHLHSHSPVCIENKLFIVGIVPILNKGLVFIYRSDRSAFIVRYQYYTINFRYKNVTQRALFFAYENVTQSVRLFVYKNVLQSDCFAYKNVTQSAFFCS